MPTLIPLFLPTAAELAEIDFSGVVMATLLWLFLLNIFGGNQAISNPDVSNPSARFDYSNATWALADRTFLNLAEQTPAFLITLWLHAIFCDADLSAQLGLVCVLARSLYPILRAVYFFLMELSTLPYYVCIYTMALNLWSKILTGELVTDSKSKTMLVIMAFGYYMSPIPFAFGLKALVSKCTANTSNGKKTN